MFHLLFKKFFSTTRQITCDRRGSMLLFVLVFGSVATMIMISGVATYALFEHRAANRKHSRDLAFHIAEAGISYYRWHLAHNPSDFTDGTGQVGPYVHDYTDKDGNVIGQFSLNITAPLTGSTVATIESTGWTEWQPESTRTIQVRVGFPSLTEYTFLSNANMNFGFTTQVHGQVHSNGGIRFDGTTDSWVKSAKDRYQYENQNHNGVWGGGGPREFWQFPVPAVDFFSVSGDLSNIRDSSNSGGVHLFSSGKEGWHLVFQGNTFKQYRVTSRDCYYGEGRWRNQGWRGLVWDGSTYCYDIKNQQLVTTLNIPANGAIFVEDNVWVDGVVNGRVSIGVGKFPAQEPYPDVYINGNLTYNEHSSDDVIGILAQGNIIVPYEAPTNLTIEAALLSQFKKIYHPYYDNGLKNSLTILGSQISYEGGGWKYVNGFGNVVTGYVNTFHNYDANLRYYPPPGFPVGDTYELISWKEVE